MSLIYTYVNKLDRELQLKSYISYNYHKHYTSYNYHKHYTR